MSRTLRNAKLDSRSARVKLPQRREPYWVAISKGCALGYRKMSGTGTWSARFREESGKQKYQALGAADDAMDADDVSVFSYSEAQRRAEVWFKKAARVDAGVEEAHVGPYKVADAMQDYLAHYAIEGKGLSVAKAIVNGRILPTLGNIGLDRLTKKHVKDWFDAVATSPAHLRTGKLAEKQNLQKLSSDPDYLRSRRSTANRIMSVLKAGLNYAFREGKVSTDIPWRRIKPFKNTSSPVIRYLLEDECIRLVNACHTDLRDMVKGALFTGCRYGELAKLMAHDFDRDAGTVLVRVSKSGKSRHVVLTEEAKDFFVEKTISKKGKELIFVHADRSAWGKSHQHRPLLAACAVARIEPTISFHVLRHTHGSLLAMRGVPLAVIAKQLGHSDTRMTEKHYAHLSPSYVAETIRTKFPNLGFEKSIGSLLKIRK